MECRYETSKSHIIQTHIFHCNRTQYQATREQSDHIANVLDKIIVDDVGCASNCPCRLVTTEENTVHTVCPVATSAIPALEDLRGATAAETCGVAEYVAPCTLSQARDVFRRVLAPTRTLLYPEDAEEACTETVPNSNSNLGLNFILITVCVRVPQTQMLITILVSVSEL